MRFKNHISRNDDGMSAVEFALIAPIMIATYFGAYEICDVLLVDRKVTDICAATTDLVAQANQISNTVIAEIFHATGASITPYTLTNLQIKVTSVIANAAGNTTVAWSDGYHTTARAVGSSYTLPAGLISPGGSVIMSEVTYTYSTPIGQFVTSGLTISDSFFQKPRLVIQIPRV